jgi:hypothetical protein
MGVTALLLGLGTTTAPASSRARRLCRSRQAPGADRRQVHPVGQRCSGDARVLPPLRDRDGRDALHRVWQMVRRDRDRRHRAVCEPLPALRRLAVIFPDLAADRVDRRPFYFRQSRICSNSSLMSESLSFGSRGRERVKLATGDLAALDRVVLAVKCSQVLEEAPCDLGRQFDRGALFAVD